MTGFQIDITRMDGTLETIEALKFDVKFSATAHLDAQPGPLVNPINKALLEALKRLVEEDKTSVSDSTWESVIRFARQAISEAEREGVNLGSPIPKGPDTEVRGDSYLQALLDIQAEADNLRHDPSERLHRIYLLVHDLINAHLKRSEGR